MINDTRQNPYRTRPRHGDTGRQFPEAPASSRDRSGGSARSGEDRRVWASSPGNGPSSSGLRSCRQPHPSAHPAAQLPDAASRTIWTAGPRPVRTPRTTHTLNPPSLARSAGRPLAASYDVEQIFEPEGGGVSGVWVRTSVIYRQTTSPPPGSGSPTRRWICPGKPRGCCRLVSGSTGSGSPVSFTILYAAATPAPGLNLDNQLVPPKRCAPASTAPSAAASAPTQGDCQRPCQSHAPTRRCPARKRHPRGRRTGRETVSLKLGSSCG